MKEKMKIGLAGLGKIGERHFNAYASLEDVEVSGVFDVNRDLCDQHSKNHGGKIFDTIDSLIESDVDAVDVCVPTDYHHEIILRALDSGKHVFCEKPLTFKMEYARQIEAKAKQVDKLVMVGYLYRFHPSFELLRDVLLKNIIGKPYYALFRIGGRGGHRAWKHQMDRAGGATFDMLTHMLDLAVMYFGEPWEVHPMYTGTILKERNIDNEMVHVDAEDCVMARLRTNGTQIFLHGDLITPSFMNTVEVHGDNGSFFGSIISRFPTTVYCKEPVDIYDRGENIFHFPPTNLIEKELQHFVGCIRNGDLPTNSIEDSIKILQITDDLATGTKPVKKTNGAINGNGWKEYRAPLWEEVPVRLGSAMQPEVLPKGA